MIEVSAPGKLMLSGEWSVLELGIPCIVMAVDKRVNTSIKEDKAIAVELPELGIERLEAEFDGELKWRKELGEEEKNKLIFTEKAIDVALKYLQEKGKNIGNFYITNSSEISSITLKNGETAKIGFGSSAAAVVSIIASILKFHGFGVSSQEEKEIVYKLGCIAHYYAQGKVGSAFDVAASTFGGMLVYKRFDADWLVKEIESGKKISELIDSKWESFAAEPLAVPENFNLAVGYAGYSASTKELVLKMREFKKENSDEYWKIINSIKEVTEKLIEAIKENKNDKILSLLKENRKLLKQLSNASGNNLETEELAKLSDIADSAGAAGKFSGAGGGDCAIAVSFDADTGNKIKEEWEKADLYPLDVSISLEGVS